MNLNKSFLSPINLVKIVSFLTIKDNSASTSNTPTKYILCKSLENGELFAIELKSNTHKVAENKFVEWFLESKAKKLLKKEFVLKIKNELEENDEEIDLVEKYCDDNKLSRKEGREWEKKYFEEKSRAIALNNKTIKPGSIIRIALSYNGRNTISYGSNLIPILDSLSLLTVLEEGKESVSQSGLFYISQTRHELPIILINNKKNNDRYNVILNKNIADISNYTTLLNHSIRTVEKKESFYLFFFNSNTGNEQLKLIIDNLNSTNKTTKTYIENILKLITMIQDNPIIVQEITIYFPLHIEKSSLLRDTEVLVTKLAPAITNISLSQQYTTNEEKNIILNNVKDKVSSYILKDSKALYGIYSILSLAEEFESDTYGFLLNNIKKHSLIFGVEDNIKLINEFKSIDFNDNSKSEGVKIATTQDGSIDF